MEDELAKRFLPHRKYRLILEKSEYILPENKVFCKKDMVDNSKKCKKIKKHIGSLKSKPKRVSGAPFELRPKIRKNRKTKQLPKAFYCRANISLPSRTYHDRNSVEVMSTSTVAPPLVSTPISLLKPSTFQETKRNTLEEDIVHKRKFYINFCDRINTSTSESLNKMFGKPDRSLKRLSIDLKNIYKNSPAEDNSNFGNGDNSENEQDLNGKFPLIAHEILDGEILNGHCQDFNAFTKDNFKMIKKSNQNAFQLNNNLSTSIPMDIDDEETLKPIKSFSILLEEYLRSNERPSKRTKPTQTDKNLIYNRCGFKTEFVNNEPSANTFSKSFDQNFSSFTKPKTTSNKYDCDLLIKKVLKELEIKRKSPERTNRFSNNATLTEFFTNATTPSKRKHEQSTTLQMFNNSREYNINDSETVESDNELLDPSLSANNVHDLHKYISPITVSSSTSSIYLEKYIEFEQFEI